MSTRRVITTAIPYVNGLPHLGFALELVQADVLARHRRGRGDEVRFQTGTDDNALKNVRAAEAAGVEVAEYVAGGARRFEALRDVLDLSFDDFLRTSVDPRHRPGVERLWRASADNGDLYQKAYSGLYCVGCEQFYTPDELTPDGRCREHGTSAEPVEEENWFFRLSRYQDRLVELLESGRLRIEPAARRREVLAFVRAGLEDFSVSRSVERAHGWGVPVPDDPSQVAYVWYDALANYVTGPGYGSDDPGTFARWWTDADEVVHVIGKGVVRFHAVYWIAMLLSAGLRLPDAIYVHDYLTVEGAKIGKSAGNAGDLAGILETYGADALRWWLLRDVARSGDTDFTPERLVRVVNEDLANTIGNLVNRSVSMVVRYRDGVVPTPVVDPPGVVDLRRAVSEAPGAVDAALARFDFRTAVAAVLAIADEGNRYVEAVRPWELAKKEDRADDLDAVLAELVAACRALGTHLAPFLPGAAKRIRDQLSGHLTTPTPVFPRLEAP